MGFIVVNKLTKEVVEMNPNNCKYKITPNTDKAHHFKRKKSALNFLDADTQKILKQAGWGVISDSLLEKFLNGELSSLDIDTPQGLDKPIIEASSKIDTSMEDMEKLKNFQHFEPTSDLSKSFEVPNIDIIETIKQFEIFLKRMKDYADILSQQYTYIECCKLDYEHKVEFDTTDLNLMKRAELNTNYSTCLKERRRIKDDILVLEKLLNASISDLIDGTLDKFFKELEDRYYRPRVAPELFEGKEVVQVKPKFKLDSLQRDTMSKEVENFNDSFEIGATSGLLEMISGFEPLPDCGE